MVSCSLIRLLACSPDRSLARLLACLLAPLLDLSLAYSLACGSLASSLACSLSCQLAPLLALSVVRSILDFFASLTGAAGRQADHHLASEMEVVEDMGPEAGSEAFPCFLPPSHGSQIAFLPPRLCYSIFPYKLPFAPMTSSQKPRLIPLLVFPLPPPHLVFIPCISSLCSLGFSGLELTSSTSSLFLSFPLLSFCTSVY